jgi:TM2 domain-containing membrane protein YozV
MTSWKKILNWLLIIFVIYLIIELIRKILGGSLGFEELVIGLLIANLGYTFYINSKLSGHIGWHKGKRNFY